MASIWDIAGVEGLSYPPLSSDIDVDAAVIGAGATGLATALNLRESGLSVAVLEAQQVGHGDTGVSTGNLYGTVSSGIERIHEKWGPEVVRTVVAARMRALDRIEANVRRFSIDCQFARRPLYRGIPHEDPGKRRKLEQEQAMLAAADLDATLVDSVPDLPLPVPHALKVENQAQYNPLRYVQGLAQAVTGLGGRIFERSRVTDIDHSDGVVRTDQAQVTARHIVHATHTPLGINMVQAEMMPIREYGVSARLNSGRYPEGVFWILDEFHSLRSYHYDGRDYLVVVGEKHKTGHGHLGEGYYQRLRDYARRHFSVEDFEHAWSAQQYVPADELPYIGRSLLTDNVYLGTGYAADGLTWGEVASEVLGDQILGRDNALSELLSPSRLTPGKSAKKWYEENKTVAEHLIKDYLKPAKLKALEGVGRGEGAVVELDGEKLAVHRTAQGELQVVSPVCPHMRCMVNWNAADSTWDCPCHGSRFKPDGSVIAGPAQQPLAKQA